MNRIIAVLDASCLLMGTMLASHIVEVADAGNGWGALLLGWLSFMAFYAAMLRHE